MQDVEESVAMIISLNNKIVSGAVDLILQALHALTERRGGTTVGKQQGKLSKAYQAVAKFIPGLGNRGEVSLKQLQADGEQVSITDKMSREDLAILSKELKKFGVTFHVLKNADDTRSVMFRAKDYDLMQEALIRAGEALGMKQGDMMLALNKTQDTEQKQEETQDFTPYNDLTDEQKKLVDSDDVNERMEQVNKREGLDVLAKDGDVSIRAAVAAQGYGLNELHKDSEPSVREEVAKQGYALNELRKDPEPSVRAAVAAQGFALDRLIKDDEPVVSEAAQKCLDEQGQTIDEWVAANPDKCVLPENIQETETKDVDVQEAKEQALNNLYEQDSQTVEVDAVAPEQGAGEIPVNDSENFDPIEVTSEIPKETQTEPSQLPTQTQVQRTQPEIKEGRYFDVNWRKQVDGEMRGQEGIYDISAKPNGEWSVTSAGEHVASGIATDGALTGAMIAGAGCARDFAHKEELSKGVDFGEQPKNSPTQAVGVGDKAQAAKVAKQNYNPKHTIADVGAKAKARVDAQAKEKPKVPKQSQTKSKGPKR